jgi:hypothetical protein
MVLMPHQYIWISGSGEHTAVFDTTEIKISPPSEVSSPYGGDPPLKFPVKYE